MKQRAFVFVSPQTPDNFLSVYMAGSLSIVELDEWVTELWLHHGILLYPSNSNRMSSNDDRFCMAPMKLPNLNSPSSSGSVSSPTVSSFRRSQWKKQPVIDFSIAFNRISTYHHF